MWRCHRLGLPVCLVVFFLGASTRHVVAEDALQRDRFVWIFGWNLTRDSDVEEITRIIETSARHGANGVVLSAGLDTLSLKNAAYFERLAKVQDACERSGLELIPCGFSIGYGGGFLAHNRHLAEGVPVVDAPFVVRGDEATLVPDPATALINGGFEQWQGERLEGYRFHDQPGVISFADEDVRRTGERSLRMENFTANPHGHGRVMQEIAVTPHRLYRLSVWVKTESLEPASGFQVSVLAGDRSIAPRQFNVAGTSDWRRISMLFNSLEFETVRVYAGVWGGRAGRFWLDDFSLEEVGPINVLRRPGTPVRVTSADGTTVYEEGIDYRRLEDPAMSPYRDHEGSPPIRIVSGGRITEGQTILASWYHPMVIHSSQVTVCMAEPEVYSIMEREAALVAKHLSPKRFLLNMDEVRMGGTCEACGGRDMAELLGECITRQVEILQRAMPGVEVYIWSDMLDPHHNARDNYYLVRGDFTGSWNHVPKDMRIAVWGGAPRPASLEFFRSQGFESIAACYYGEGDLSNVARWLDDARRIGGVRGFMYTVWEKEYGLVPDFGRLLGWEAGEHD